MKSRSMGSRTAQNPAKAVGLDEIAGENGGRTATGEGQVD